MAAAAAPRPASGHLRPRRRRRPLQRRRLGGRAGRRGKRQTAALGGAATSAATRRLAGPLPRSTTRGAGRGTKTERSRTLGDVVTTTTAATAAEKKARGRARRAAAEWEKEAPDFLLRLLLDVPVRRAARGSRGGKGTGSAAERRALVGAAGRCSLLRDRTGMGEGGSRGFISRFVCASCARTAGCGGTERAICTLIC